MGGEIGEISLPAVLLISEAASFITGQIIIIDGGWTVKGFVE